MRAVIKPAPAPGVAYREDWAIREPGAGEVLVDVAAASLCGTDRELAEWTPSAQAFRLSPPVVLGHEGSGTIVALGDGVTGFAVGDRVAFESHIACGVCFECRTGTAHTCPRTRIVGMHIDGLFAEQAVVPAQVCVRVPDSISLEAAALLEGAGVGMHAIQRAGGDVAGQNVLVNGAGPVGLFTAQIARALGAANVVVVEPNPFRRGQAESIGATAVAPGAHVVELCRDLAGHRGGFDAAFEVSGVRGVMGPLLESLRHEGTIVTVGHPSQPAELDIASQINKRGITLRGIFGRRLWDTWEQLLLLVGSGQVDLEWIITHRLPLSQADEAIELLTGDAGKVLLVPSLG